MRFLTHPACQKKESSVAAIANALEQQNRQTGQVVRAHGQTPSEKWPLKRRCRATAAGNDDRRQQTTTREVVRRANSGSRFGDERASGTCDNFLTERRKRERETCVRRMRKRKAKENDKRQSGEGGEERLGGTYQSVEERPRDVRRSGERLLLEDSLLVGPELDKDALQVAQRWIASVHDARSTRNVRRLPTRCRDVRKASLHREGNTSSRGAFCLLD